MFSIQAQAMDFQSPQSLDSPATKIDIVIASLYGRLGCKLNYSTQPLGTAWTGPKGSLDIVEPELCMADLDYLPNAKTIRMSFSISNNHDLVHGFDKLDDEHKLEAISSIAISLDHEITRVIKKISLLIGSESIKIEFIVSYKGYRALRNNKGEIKSATYEVKGF